MQTNGQLSPLLNLYRFQGPNLGSQAQARAARTLTTTQRKNEKTLLNVRKTLLSKKVLGRPVARFMEMKRET
ncbi:MAG: hypothetical protein ACOX6Y_07560 [Christensenellales bacterium]